MSQKQDRKIRRSVSKLYRDAVEKIREYVAELPAKDRVKLAFNILFRKKFGF